MLPSTEAQDDTSIQERFDRFGQKLTEIGQSLAEKTKTAFQDLHNSEFGTSTRYSHLQEISRFIHIGAHSIVCHLTRVYFAQELVHRCLSEDERQIGGNEAVEKQTGTCR